VLCRRFLPAKAALAALLSAAGALAQTAAPETATQPPATKPEWNEILTQPKETSRLPPPGLPQVKFSNFTSCPITEMQIYVPELAHLEPAQDQSQLNTLLDRIGAKALEIANQTPNLVSREAVVSQNGQTKKKQTFSYLVLQHHLRSNVMVFDEFRVDVATGEKFQTEFGSVEAPAGPPGQPPGLTDPLIASRSPHTAGPLSKGFVGAWLYFYPSNRTLLDFRYLGLQRMHHVQTLVISFAQKRGSPFSGAMVGFEGKNYPVFVQGVAWVEAADFRIVRLETDLLSLPAALPLQRLTSDIDFAQFPVAELPSPLWLPRRVTVAEILGAVNLQEDHIYSNYRLFRTRSKLVLK